MSQEGTESDDVTGQQGDCQDDEGNGEDHNEFQQSTVVGLQLTGIGNQKSRKEEIVQQIDVQGASSNILQGF